MVSGGFKTEVIVCPWEDGSGFSFKGQSQGLFSPQQTKWHDFKAFPGTYSLHGVKGHHQLLNTRLKRHSRYQKIGKCLTKYTNCNVAL